MSAEDRALDDENERRAMVEPALLEGVEADDVIALPREVAHYFTRVLRLVDGEEVSLLDGEGRVIDGALVTGDAPGVRVRAARVVDDPLPPLVVYQALVRGAKLDEVVQRATELGADRVVVFRAERSNVPTTACKLDRLARVAQDATRQSRRTRALKVSGVLTLAQVCDELARVDAPTLVCVVGAERAASGILSADVRTRTNGARFVIGPEGGLSDDERAVLVAAGATPCALGAHVLRTETAGLAALAAAQAALGAL